MISSIATPHLIGAIGFVVAAAVATAALIVFLRPWLQRYALARPNARSSHKTPTPQGGGIAVIAATLVLSVLVLTAGVLGPQTEIPWAVFAAVVFIAVIGAIDDIRPIPVAPRLFLQILAIAAVIAALPPELQVLPFIPWWLDRVLLLIAGVWFVNLTNFMDGIDWITVAEVVPITAGLVLIGLLGALPLSAVVVALALGGAMLGFAPFNRPVARLFLGDVGSLPIGLLLFWLLTLLADGGHLAAAIILPLYYLADATVTLLRRMRNGEPFWEAHRSHFYQRATDRGYRVLDIVARIFLMNIVLIIFAAFTVVVHGLPSAVVALVCACLLVARLLTDLSRGRK